MPKNILEDVLPPERRSIRDIPLPGERRRTVVNDGMRPVTSISRPQIEEREEETVSEPDTSLPQKKPSRVVFWSIVVGSLLILIFSFLTVFGDAMVYVTPKNETITLDAVFTAKKQDVEGALTYDVITLSKNGSKTIIATGEKQVDTKASGKIIIYNTESNSQTLIKNTRFETSSGLIYRINDAVNVPAKVESKPGSLEVKVFADGIGAKYNIGLSDFTVPGFAGTPKFETIYARSTTPMSGGSSGLQKTASEADLNQARNEIEANLRNELLLQARSETPEGFVLFDSSAFIEFELLPHKSLPDTSLEVSEEGELHGLIFNKSILTKVIAQSAISDYDNGSIEIADLEKIVFNASSTLGALWEQDEISFTLAGVVPVTSLYDEEMLRKLLAGKSLGVTKSILAGETYLDPNTPADVVIRPFWKKTLPRDINKIKILNRD